MKQHSAEEIIGEQLKANGLDTEARISINDFAAYMPGHKLHLQANSRTVACAERQCAHRTGRQDARKRVAGCKSPDRTDDVGPRRTDGNQG